MTDEEAALKFLSLLERFVVSCECASAHLPDYSNLFALNCPACGRIFLLSCGSDFPMHPCVQRP